MEKKKTGHYIRKWLWEETGQEESYFSQAS